MPPPMPPGQSDQNAWNIADQNGWIHDANVPLTLVAYPETVTMSPPCDNTVSCTFSRRMLACPLTINGPPGSEPDNKAVGIRDTPAGAARPMTHWTAVANPRSRPSPGPAITLVALGGHLIGLSRDPVGHAARAFAIRRFCARS